MIELLKLKCIPSVANLGEKYREALDDGISWEAGTDIELSGRWK
jgi:hypothetical protein